MPKSPPPAPPARAWPAWPSASTCRRRGSNRSSATSAAASAPGAANAAIARRDEYRELAGELRGLARRLPDAQASAKVGAYRATLDALDGSPRSSARSGSCPTISARIRSQRALVEAVFAVFVEHDVPEEARLALIRRLGPEEEAA